VSQTKEQITVIGARENNLKNISIQIPKNKLVVITGVSGSGKSSLAFDTIFAEGQRRYVESLSAYARQFLGQVDKPDVDSIEGLSPAIAIDQKSTHKNPRSTVGTVTEIYDHLRLLFGRIGLQHCPVCEARVQKQSIDQMIKDIYKQATDKRIMLAASLIENKKGDHSKLFDRLRKEGFSRAMVNGEILSLNSDIELKKSHKHNIRLIVDRFVVNADNRSRLADSLQLTLGQGEGRAECHIFGEDKEKKEIEEILIFSDSLACPNGHGSLSKLSPQLFSFNSPQGACPECHGLGYHKTFSPEKLIPNPSLPLIQAIVPWAKSSYQSYYAEILTSVANAYGESPNALWKDLKPDLQQAVLYGTDHQITLTYTSYDGSELLSTESEFKGVIPKLNKKYHESTSDRYKADLENYMEQTTCQACQGHRLKKEALSTTVGGYKISQITDMSITEALSFFEELPARLNEHDQQIVSRLLQEITQRLAFLSEVGLNYLTLSRAFGTLSGGEAQRIRLATQIGSGLSGILYVLDEPSIGLHQRDNDRLLATLQHLKSLGNTVIVVEHDEDTMKAADWVIDIGTEAGRAGGYVIAAGHWKKLSKSPKSLTARYLSGQLLIRNPKQRRPGNSLNLQIKNAHLNNLKNVDLQIPLGKMIAVTGVSGSGKSTLIMELLLPYLESFLKKNKHKPAGIDEVIGLENIDKVIEIDQSPIGRTPHSNPATYTGAFTPIRELFASLNEAKVRAYQPGHFSFNVKGRGRCENCQGQGQLEIEMHFLPSVYIKCPVCQGKRYTQEILEIKFKDHSISDVLDMSVNQALNLFESIPAIYNKLHTLQQVGLGYITLGQSALTLSGGEAQRIKLATELSKRQSGKTLYILDEPTTGLHWHDVNKLLSVLHKLVDCGNTVLVIEHNLDVIKTADWLIDLGPEGGSKGGQVIAEGTPEKVSANSHSITGHYLKEKLNLKEKPSTKLSTKSL